MVCFRSYDNAEADLCTAIGIYFLLTIQAWMALMQPHRRRNRGSTEHRLALLFYVFITFVFGSITTALNIKYTLLPTNLRATKHCLNRLQKCGVFRIYSRCM